MYVECTCVVNSIIIENIWNPSTYVYIYVVVPPTIIRQPGQQFVDIYQNVTFHCEADGFQVTYLWKKCDGDVHPVLARCSNLVLSDVTPFDNGQYYCEVINDGGATPSNIVTLEVKGNHYTS